MLVLGIETSCDETGVALYDSARGLLADGLYSQVARHARYGGVIPELASRDHIRKTLPLIEEVLGKAGIGPGGPGRNDRRSGRYGENAEPQDQRGGRCAGNAEPQDQRGGWCAGNAEPRDQRGGWCAGNAEPQDQRGDRRARNAMPYDQPGDRQPAVPEAQPRGQQGLSVPPPPIDGVAYTAGPGLVGALLVGASLGRALALSWGVPAIGVHHMEGHLLAPMLEPEPPPFPFVALLVSGGHTQLVAVTGIGRYQLLGESLDDAAGEAFDKVGKLLGLPYPGGPQVAKLAVQGQPGRFQFPRPMTNRPGLDFSFSGLKTRVRTTLAELTAAQSSNHARSSQQIAAAADKNQNYDRDAGDSRRTTRTGRGQSTAPAGSSQNAARTGRGQSTAPVGSSQSAARTGRGKHDYSIAASSLDQQTKADIARAFEEAIVDTLVIKCRRALQHTGLKSLVIAGGVSANQQLRTTLEQAVTQLDARLFYAAPRFCTDNGAMIAYAGCQRLLAGEQEPLSIIARPRWSLETLAAI